ncbi:MAG: hypothetical protein ABI844_18830 [Saprospiraceae bacterium]
MKKATLFTVFIIIVIGSILTSCDSPEKKVEEAKQGVTEAKENLKEALQELNAEYPAFKTEAELKIADNEKSIAELNAILNKPGKLPLDEMRKKKIAELKEKNAQLKSRLYGYEKERTDWEAFKREFNHDLEGISEAFKDLGKKNTN